MSKTTRGPREAKLVEMDRSLLILVKHAAPQVTPGMSPDLWPLSEEGRRRCGVLAERLRDDGARQIVTSEEAKAIETGKLLAEALEIPASALPGLEEHDRSDVPHMRSGDFISSMELAFRRPADRVLGRESIAAALQRFEPALDQALRNHPGNCIVVSHGAVLAAWLAPRMQRKPFEIWRAMGLPSYAVIDRQNMKVMELVEQVK